MSAVRDGRARTPAAPHDGRAASMRPPWPRVKLGEVCEVHIGKTPPRGVPDYWCCADGDGMVWLSIADLLNTVEGVVAASKERITHTALDSCGVPIVKKGTFLLSFKLTLGRCAVAGCDLCTNEAIAALPFRNEYADKVDMAYLRRYCEYFDWNAFAEKDEKVLGKTLNKKKIAEVPIMLPPLPVQREIVARLERELGAVDELAKKFEELEQAAEAEFKAKLAEEMGRLGQMGQLGRDAAVADIPGVADVPLTPTRWAKLGEICEILDSQRVPITKIERKSGPYPYYGASGIVDYVADYIFDGNYLLVSEDGANLLARSTPIAFSVSGKLWVNNHAHILAFDEMTTQTYVEYFFEATKFDELITGAAQPKLTQKALAGIELPLPPLPAQREIVARLDAAKARKEALVSAAKRGREAAAVWRKAILKEAFDG